ncbi:MAG TPA: hypothetical protein ENJ82_11525 [Bacteroidetes bacterium]|nr:hypothetical protein [Bacteroidota bacterium]
MGGSERINQTESASNQLESQEGMRTMTPPSFGLVASGEDSSPSSNGQGQGGGANSAPVAQRQAAASVIQREEDYQRFPDAVRNVLIGQATSPGEPGHPNYYRGIIPRNCLLVLWDLHKANHWEESFGETAQVWAMRGIQGMRDLMRELGANGVPGPPLLQEVRNSLALIANPNSGSAAGNSMEEVLQNTIDAARVSREQTRSYSRQVQFAEKLHAVLPAAANILSSELNAEIPGQILNTTSPYNYHYYRGNPGIRGSSQNCLTALYRARWEVRSASQRRRKIDYGINNLSRLLSERNQRTMFEALTMLSESEIAANVASIQAAINSYIRNRANTIKADAEITQIARNGAAIPHRRRRSRGGGGRRAAPIEYEEGSVVTPWENTLTGITTSAEARAQLGDEPHMTLAGQNIGAFMPAGGNASKGYYPYVRNGKSFQIICNTNEQSFFGIKYGGGSHLTYRAIDSLLNDSEHNYFTDAQKIIVRSIRPHVASEGGVSTINTYDAQYLTVAGRGEKAGLVSVMVNAAERLMADYGTPVNLSRVRSLVRELGAASPTGTAGVRLDIEKIEELILILDQPDIHRAMTLAKINDAILRFHGVGLRGNRYDRNVSSESEARLTEASSQHNLHEAIIGIAIHNSIGAPAEFRNPMEYAIRANQLFPQRAGFSETVPDFEQLSKQVAYLMKIRMQNKWNRAGHVPTVNRRYTNIFHQKVLDFDNYFSNTDVERIGSSYFDYQAASSVLPFWTGRGNYVSQSEAPPSGTLAIRKVARRGHAYYLMGPMLPGAATSLEHQVDLDQEPGH